jgi:lipopolysaccharide export system permease protein
MIRTLDRYITREFLRLFVLFSLAAPLLFILGDWTDNIDTYTERSIPLGDVALGYLFTLPQFIVFSLPIAGLIATVFTVSSMTRHSELAAAKAGGISFHRATRMLPLLGIVFTLAGLALNDVVPLALQRSGELFGSRPEFRGSRNDFVYRSEDGTVYGIRRLDLDASRIFGVSMQREGDRQTRPTINAFAREAIWDSIRGWSFSSGYFRTITPEEREQTLQFRTLIPTRLHERPEELLAEPKEPDEMRYSEMGRFIAALQRSGGEPNELKFSQAERLAIPVATFIIILFGAPLANSGARSGPAYGIGVSLGITIVYLMLFRVMAAVGEAGLIDPYMAAWVPNGLFLVAALFLNARVRT